MRASFVLPFFISGCLFAQLPSGVLPPPGDNQKATTVQYIGPVRVSIDYSSPSVHGPNNGPDRRGQIWGKLVPYGMIPPPFPGFGNGKPMPWRGGANENTVFSVSHPVLIDGKPLPAGNYGLHFIPSPTDWILVFSKNSTSWGSFFYDEAEDALRITVKPFKHEYREWLTYEFTKRMPAEAAVEMQWEDLAVGFQIKVDNIRDVYISNLRNEIRASRFAGVDGYTAAIQYCVSQSANLDEALVWANLVIAQQPDFQRMSLRPLVLTAQGKTAEAEAALKAAMNHPTASPVAVNAYGRGLLAAGKKQEALKAFQMSAEKFGDNFRTNVGLTRGYAAAGDKEKALAYARKALTQAPNDAYKGMTQALIDALNQGRSID